MISEAKKLYIIEEVLKINNNATLAALEKVLTKSKKEQNSKDENNFTEFSGIWSKDEAEEVEKIIAGACETIHPDDWK